MVFIKDYILERLEEETSIDVAQDLGVTVAMLSSYKNHRYNASLTVAKKVFAKYGVTLHPFAKDSLKFEIERDENAK